MVKYMRRIIFLVFIMALCFAMIFPVLSFADFRIDSSFVSFAVPAASNDMSSIRFGQWMTYAFDAANILIDSTLPYTAPVVDYIVDPFNINDGIIEAINYSFPSANLTTPSLTLKSYLERSSIQVRGDTITIDGIDYQDIWVTNDAAQALRTNVLDLQTAWNIASNSNGKFVSGAGHVGDTLIYDVGGTLRSTALSISVGGGSYQIGAGYSIGVNSGSSSPSYWCYGSGSNARQFYTNTSSWPIQAYLYLEGTAIRPTLRTLWKDGQVIDYYASGAHVYTAAPFDFVWTSSVIPAERLDSDEGIHLLVPNNPEQFSDEDVQQNIRNFNLNLNNNFDFDSLIDLAIDNNYSLFDSLMDLTLNLEINPSFGTYNSVEPAPVPTPTPEPVPWPTLEPTPEPTLEPTPEPTSSPDPTPEPTAIPTSPIGDTPYNYLGNALDGINSHLEAQEYNFFGNVVEAISEPFEPLLKVLESTTSIWRYVVMWVGNISAPFNWSLAALGSAGSYFLSPFAAIAAAAIVIAIYRRFLK